MDVCTPTTTSRWQDGRLAQNYASKRHFVSSKHPKREISSAKISANLTLTRRQTVTRSDRSARPIRTPSRTCQHRGMPHPSTSRSAGEAVRWCAPRPGSVLGEGAPPPVYFSRVRSSSPDSSRSVVGFVLLSSLTDRSPSPPVTQTVRRCARARPLRSDARVGRGLRPRPRARDSLRRRARAPLA